MPALRHRLYRGYLAGSFISSVGTTIQTWTIAWHIYHLTGSSLMVGLLGIVRVVPLLVFSLFGGVVADQADRRKVMLATQSAMAAISLVLFWATFREAIPLWLLYSMVALNATAGSFDMPSRQAMVVGLVPREDFPNAVSLNGIAWRLSDVLGPMFAGLLIAWKGVGSMNGLAASYLLNFVSFFAVLVAVYRVGPRPVAAAADRPKSFNDVVALIREGLQFVNRTPVIRSAMWIDFWATFLSGAQALLPAFAGSILKLGPEGYGILAASTGVGALLSVMVTASLPTVRRQGALVVWMIGAYGFFTIAFGLSQTLWMAAVSLALVGAADMISTVMRQTIRQLATPDELRGRMNATASLFHMSGPQLGDFEAGAVADWLGVRFSIVLGGALCLYVSAHWSRAKALLDYTHEG